MKLIVVGASSFTGRYFCTYARQLGAEVIEANMRYMSWFPQAKDNYVVNFAAVNVVAPSWELPGHYMKTNVGLVTKLAEGLREYLPARYVHISTPEVYGNTTGFIREEAPYNPSTPYAVSRAAAEMMLRCYHKQYGLPVVFTRSCNVYGPGQQLYRLIPKIIVCAKKGIPFPLEGKGSSKRAFLHVDDACAAIWKVMTDGTPGEAYNVSRLATNTIENIVESVGTILGTKPVIEQVPDRPGKDAGYFLNDDKLRDLGWSDRINLHTGIKTVIDWVNQEWEILKDQSMEYRP